MKLFSYQESVLDAIESDPCHSQLISMPTGTGKTITFLHVAKKKNMKCLILVHREELLNQTLEKAKLVGFQESDIALVTSSKKEEIKPITIAMVPTLVRNLEKYNPQDISMIIVDEAHHATAPSYRKIFDFFKIFEYKKFLFGFTATPLRADKDCLSSIFLSHSFKMTLSEATKAGYICPVYGLRVEIDKSLKEIDIVHGDYDVQALDRVINCKEVNEVIVKRCFMLRKHPGIIFCTSVNHAETLARMLREKKKKAISVSYHTPKKTLERIYTMLKRGSVDFITNAVKLSEGFDYPPIQSIIIARPTRSPVLYKQMIGRGLRKSPGKEDCVVVEFTGSDPSMMNWEDIDENATFQILTEKEKLSDRQVMQKVASSFGDKVKVLDVRLSQFSFYECKIARLVRYRKDFYYMPSDKRFIIYRVIPAVMHKSGFDRYYNVIAWHCVWHKEFEDFYVWNEGPIYYDKYGYPAFRIELIMKEYIDRQPLGKWYPSELDIMSPRQKRLLPNEHYTARKAEFMIEDKFYKMLIDEKWINGEHANVDKVVESFYDA